MVKQKRAKAGKLFAAACPSWAAVQAAGNHVPMACVLSADRRINGQDSAVKVADAENHFLHERGIVGKNRGYQRAGPAANHGDKVFRAVISHKGHYRAEDLEIMDIFGGKPVVAGK